MRAVFPAHSARLFTLCGDHDMYGGGVPYYALLDRLGQPASFFCLRNPHWQLLAMDTGYNDFDPFRVDATATWVQDGTDEQGRSTDDNYSEPIALSPPHRAIQQAANAADERRSAKRYLSRADMSALATTHFRRYMLV
jgi:hypothetical protein